MSGELIRGLSFEKYLRLARVNWSLLKLMAKSPAQYRHALTTPRQDTPAFKVGRATHVASLQPERFQGEVVLWDGGTRRGKLWDKFEAEHEGQEILTESEWESVHAMSKAARSDATAAKYLSGGVGEVSVLWRYEAPAIGALPGFAIDCKSRVDFAQVGALVDLKTCRDASPEGFGRAAWNFKYQCQAAFYVDAWEAATGVRLPYVIVAVESAAPHIVQVYRLPDELLEAGRQEYRALLGRLHQCQSTATWPGYAEGEVELVPPKWAGFGDESEDASGLGLTFTNDGATP